MGDILKAGEVEPLRNFNAQGQEKAFGDKEGGEGADVCKNAQGQRNAIGAKEGTDAAAAKGGGVADKCGDILKVGEVEPLSNFKAQGQEKAFGDKKWGGGQMNARTHRDKGMQWEQRRELMPWWTKGGELLRMMGTS